MGHLRDFFFGPDPDEKTVRSNFWAGVSFLLVVILFTLILLFG